MKNILSGIALAALLASPAMAADMPVRMPVKAPAPVVVTPSWTGFYIGAHAGYGWGSNGDVETSYLPDPAAFNGQPFSTGIRPKGFMGGAQAGYNQQVGSIVYGIEADFSWSDVKDSAAAAPFLLFGGAPLVGASNHAFRQELDWFGTVRARLGVTVTPAVLAYVTGGLAYGSATYSATTDIVPGAPGFLFVGSDRKTNIGWTVGGGLEMSLGGNWSIKGEYLYYDLGDHTVIASRSVAGAPGFFVTSAFESNGHIARAGINYRFGGPVVARY